jgi:hypothetical protein
LSNHRGFYMEKKVIIFGIFSLLFVVGFSGCLGPQATEYFNGSYPVTEQTILKVINKNGQVEIAGWDGNNVTVNAVKRSGTQELNKIEINVNYVGNYLNIETRYTGLSTFSVDINIKVPRGVHIESVTSSNGAIFLTDTIGNVTTLTSNGAININNVDGYVSAETSNAHVEVKGATGIKYIHTSNGAITGEVDDIQEDVNIETSNAAITVYINPSINATIDMRTSNSKINIEGVSLNVQSLEDTHVLGTLGSNGHRLDIHTSNANIYLINLVISITFT